MGIKALGYIVVETAQPAEWDRFLTEFVGVMRTDDAPDGPALYRVDDRVFRFRIENVQETVKKDDASAMYTVLSEEV